MKQFLIFSVLFFGAFSSIFSQSNLSDYSFVVVPENFAFTSEKDQYQLNSMTKFYLNKNGFNAMYQLELPRVSNCDGLYVDVVSKGTFLVRKIVVLLKDCQGNIIFESEEGRSKKKGYKLGYQESLRNAFKSFEKLNVDQVEIIEDKSVSNVEQAASNRQKASEAILIEGTKEKDIDVIVAAQNKKLVVGGPNDKFTYFKIENLSFLLRQSKAGYFLYREDQTNEMGLVLLGEITRDQKDSVYRITGHLNGIAKFQKNGDLIIVENDKAQLYKIQN